MAQLKLVVDDELLRKFRQIVLIRHGKIELTPEGEDAIRLYIAKYEHLLKGRHSRESVPLKRSVGAIKSDGRHNALTDLKELESEAL